MNLTKSPKSETLKLLRPAKLHPAIRSILREFPKAVRFEIGKAIYELQKGVKLAMPMARPMPNVGSNVHEIRVRDRSGAYRVFYFTMAEDGVYIFHAFKKTTPKTLKKEIELGKERLREML